MVVRLRRPKTPLDAPPPAGDSNPGACQTGRATANTGRLVATNGRYAGNMANPAELLHAQLRQWRGPANVAAQNARNVPSFKGWADHRRAVMLLKDIEDLLTIAETDHGLNMSHARRHFDRWTQMVFAFPNGWASAGNHSIDSASLEQLEATATTLDMVVPKFVENGADSFSTFLDIVRAKIDGEDEFFREHANRVINHLQGLLNDWEHLGEFRIVDAIRDLTLILNELEKRKPDDPFIKQASTAVWGFFRKDIAAAMIAGIALAALPQPEEVLQLVSSQVREITSGSDATDETGSEAHADDKS